MEHSRAEHLAAENNRLRDEIEELKEKLALYEEAGPTEAEEDKRRVEKIFQMFDTDHNNNIDGKEFQQLAFQLGEALTNEEVTEAIKQIDKNQDGVITFDEFYDWWSSAEHPDVRDDTERAKQLRVLKMKLRSQSYMRAVSRLVEKVNQKAAAQELVRKAEQGSRGSEKGKEKEHKEEEHEKEKTEETEGEKGEGKGKEKQREQESEEGEETFKVNAKAQMGELGEARCSGRLVYDPDVKRAEARRLEFGAEDNSAIITVAFTINDGIDDFELGELSGSIKDILSMKLKYTCLRSRLIDAPDGEKEKGAQRLFEMTLVFEDTDTVEAAGGLISAFQVRQLDVYAEISQSPLDPDSLDFLSGRGTIHAEVANSGLEFIQGTFGDGEDPTVRGSFGDIFTLGASLKGGTASFKFEDVGPLFRQAFQETEFVTFKGWQSAKQILMPHLTEFMTDKEVPPAILLAYNTTKAALKGLHSVSVQVGDNAFHFTAHNADVITFLPTAHELGIEDL